MTEDELVERMARRLCAIQQPDADTDAIVATGDGFPMCPLWMCYEPAARAALAVVREAEGWRPITDDAPALNEIAHLGWRCRLFGDWKQEIACAQHGWRRANVNNISRHGLATHYRPLPTPPEGEV